MQSERKNHQFFDSSHKSVNNMIKIVILSAIFTLSKGGLISHDIEHDDHHKATSYQSIKFEHFHAVPTYVKKEDTHLLKHPVSSGHTGAKLEVHHGGKHDHGYAIADHHSTLHHGHGGDDFSGLEQHEGHAYIQQEEETPSHGYENAQYSHENIDYHQLQEALSKKHTDTSGLGLGHYH